MGFDRRRAGAVPAVAGSGSQLRGINRRHAARLKCADATDWKDCKCAGSRNQTFAAMSRWHQNHVVSAVGIAAIVAAAFIYNAWLLDSRNFFYADDWQWLWRAEFLPLAQHFGILPVMVYNDRPIGVMLI